MDSSSASDDETSIFLLEQSTRISQTSHNLIRQRVMVLDTLHPQHGGSSFGRRYIDQDREAGHLQLMKDYFSDTSSTYNEDLFRRRYRMRRSLFTKILNDVTNFDTYFMRRKNATRKWGALSHQKMTPVMMMLIYGIPANATNEYSRLDYEGPDDPINESDDESDPEDRLRRAVSRYDGVEETPSSQSAFTLEEKFARQHLIWSSTIHARLKHDLIKHI
ncbi:hypothetical protein QYF36_001153 [Acer negundo]|nr:hypothetical protein QYF36_001153 [Acer negundo]